MSYTRSEGDVFREAARLFRQAEPRPDERLEAYVVAADRQVQQEDGLVTFKTFIDGRAASVRARLPKGLYSKALEAHDRKDAVLITGDLVRHGQRWHLDAPRDLVILDLEKNSDEL